jgi:type IV pilus assembly protein PilY1
VDYTTSLLFQGKETVFAREVNNCYPTHHRVTYQTGVGKVLLKYIEATSTTEICSGSPWQSQYSDDEGYFYFDRAAGRFVDDDDSDLIRIFLPYATYSVDVNSTGNYVTRYDYNYMNWLFYHSTQADRDELKTLYDDSNKRAQLTRVLVAKQVTKNLIDNTTGVRFGLMTFDGSTGGLIKADIPSDLATLHAAIDGIWVGGSTPLAEALEDAWDYFRGIDVGGHSLDSDFWCRENSMIVMTDGLPQNDADDLSGYIKRDWDGDSGGTEGNDWVGNEESLYAGEGSGYLDDIAHYMRNNDARDDLQDIQNVTTYTIGFTVNNSLLENTATNGEGVYHTAQNADELSAAFFDILGQILEVSNTYTAPVVPISQMEKTTSGNRIYMALFKPTRSAFWKGNIKKFGLAGEDDMGVGVSQGDVIDRHGNTATDSLGNVHDSAVSYWGDVTPDGGEVELGGVGEVLLNREEPRNIYSILCGDYTHHQPFTHEHNAFLKTNKRITPELLGATNDAEKDRIVDFVHGYDAYDEDGDGNTSEKRDWILGAFIHSRPEVVHYDATTTVIYAGANDGMLHAFDDATGEEMWAFIPPDLLERLRDSAGNTLSFFVDGSPRAYVMDNDHDGTIEKGDSVILVFGERRGGSHFYALDVSEPTAPSVIWNINPGLADFEEMGQTWCTPAFGLVADKKPAVFLSGGYDPNQDDDPVVLEDTMGRGIYVLDLFAGDLIWKYTYDDDSTLQWSIPSDIAAIDTTDNGVTDRLYVGDMGGRLWRFDIEALTPAEWTGEILFNANSPFEEGRKIFYAPDVTLEYGYEYVFFATGDRAHPKDGTVVNRIYAVKDGHTGVTLGEDALVDVTDDLLQDSGTAEEVKADIMDSLDQKGGWYIRLITHPGEKVLSSPLLVFGDAYFTTYTPPQEEVGDPCSMEKGTARLYALDYMTGGATLNLDSSNDSGDVVVLERADRSLIIGDAIPSALVMAIIRGEFHAYVGIGGGIFRPNIPQRHTITRIYWRQL